MIPAPNLSLMCFYAPDHAGKFSKGAFLSFLDSKYFHIDMMCRMSRNIHKNRLVVGDGAEKRYEFVVCIVG